jgi:hypothetical protein
MGSLALSVACTSGSFVLLGNDAGAGIVPDAAREASGFVDAARDSPSRRDDTGLVDARVREGGLDASTDAGRDVGETSDARDATPGFCATQLVPQGATFICDDFDEVADATALGSYVVTAGGSLAVEDAVSRSPPNALYVEAVPIGNATASHLARSIPPAHTVMLAYAVRPDIAPADAGDAGLPDNYFSGVSFANGSMLFVILGVGADGGVSSVFLEEGVDVPGESQPYYVMHKAAAWPASGWGQVSMKIYAGPGGELVDDFSVNGVAVEVAAPLQSEFQISAGGTATIGFGYSKGNGKHAAYIDNVVLWSSL